jgi:hypothetical protein
MSIKLITLKTNHTIMGGVDVFDTYITIKKTVQVVTVPPSVQNPQGGVAFTPFVEFAQEFRTGFKIYNQDILFISTPVVELENQYNEIFGSGIQIATSIPKV